MFDTKPKLSFRSNRIQSILIFKTVRMFKYLIAWYCDWMIYIINSQLTLTSKIRRAKNLQTFPLLAKISLSQTFTIFHNYRTHYCDSVPFADCQIIIHRHVFEGYKKCKKE
jgi:hypothetical protein